MAQDTFINITVDANAGLRASIEAHAHTAAFGSAASGDVTLSYDSTKVANINILNSVLNSIRERARARGIK